jgi:[acyl-carrier-protein] S-malonyltransferase
MIEVAFIFPGQGSQYVGMGKEFYESSKEAKALFEEANNVIPGLINVVFNGPQEKLTSTAFCQPAIFTYSLAVLEAFKASPQYKNIVPRFVCGLSLGECSAIVASQSVRFSDALKMIERRAYFMEEATRLTKGAMAAVIGFEKEKLVEICRLTGAQIANFNAPDQIVITGELDKVYAASEKIKEAGAKRVIPLEFSGGFHSTLMQSAVPKFEEELKRINFKEAEIPIISNVDACPSIDPTITRSKLARQITSSVLWVDTIEFIVSQGVTKFIEIGPGTVLKGLIRKINKDLTVYNIQKPEDILSIPV